MGLVTVAGTPANLPMPLNDTKWQTITVQIMSCAKDKGTASLVTNHSTLGDDLDDQFYISKSCFTWFDLVNRVGFIVGPVDRKPYQSHRLSLLEHHDLIRDFRRTDLATSRAYGWLFRSFLIYPIIFSDNIDRFIIPSTPLGTRTSNFERQNGSATRGKGYSNHVTD